MDACHRATVGSPPVASRLDLMNSYALVGRVVLDAVPDGPGTSSSSGMVAMLEKCSSERSLSLPFAATNSFAGRIWNVPSAPSAVRAKRIRRIYEANGVKGTVVMQRVDEMIVRFGTGQDEVRVDLFEHY